MISDFIRLFTVSAIYGFGIGMFPILLGMAVRGMIKIFKKA